MREYEIWAKTEAFRRKLDRARIEIDRATSGDHQWVVSSSWGKDSCALVGLVSEVRGERFEAAHLRSPYELPGYEHVLEWARERCTVYTIDSTRTLSEYIEWLSEHGLGYERESQQSAGKKAKADQLIDWVRGNGYQVQLLGMRADESKARRTCFTVRGLTYPAHGLTVSNPIGWWTARDVWAYLVSRGIPWHPLYDATTHGYTREQLRNAGWLSVARYDDGRTAWLRSGCRVGRLEAMASAAARALSCA